MPNLLDGKIVRDKIKGELKEKFANLSVKPHLAIIQVGDKEDSNIYINQKVKFGDEVGIKVLVFKFESTVSFIEISNKIVELNQDPNIGGIIVQLPLPEHLPKTIINLIDPKKDVDALTDYNKNQLSLTGKASVIPATAKAIFNLLNFYSIDVSGKEVVVLGRSDLVGRPTALMLKTLGANVSVVHSQTKNPEEIASKADLLVVAIGKPQLIGFKYINRFKKPVVIDVGIHKVDGKTVGDVNFDEVKDLVSSISPVPGGVGPLTVASLFENLYDLSVLNS